MPARIFLSASWEYLAMFNYEVDPAVLQKHLPPHTEIDYFNAKALVSVVGFLFNNTRVLGIRWPGFTNFEEVNLRYYVRHYDGNSWRRGVGFVSEIVPSPLIAGIANRLYNEHYSTALLNHKIEKNDRELMATYNWKKRTGSWNSLQVTAKPGLMDIQPGSQEEFIFEHYYGYNKLNATTAIEYTLKHPRWQVYPVTDFHLSCDVENLYGKEFVPFIKNITPVSVYLAKGSDVLINLPRRITG